MESDQITKKLDAAIEAVKEVIPLLVDRKGWFEVEVLAKCLQKMEAARPGCRIVERGVD